MSEIQMASDRRSSEATLVEQTRAVAEVAAMVRVAQENPRDMARAVEQMRMSCSQKALASRAFYSLPRAGGRVEGSTVHLARELARIFGNFEFGIRETRRDDDAGVSELTAWAWDTETNSRQSRSFVVPHARMKGGSRQALTDLSDIANNNNSVAARALRECILTLLPVWFRDEAESLAAKALAGGAAEKPLPEQIADVVKDFAAYFNVTPDQLEARLQRPRAKWTVGDVATLRVIGSEINRGEKDAVEEFPEQPLQIAPVRDGSEPSEAEWAEMRAEEKR